MADPTEAVSGLIERIEAGGGPDRELDCRIWCLVGLGSQYDETNCWLAATVRPPEMPALGLTLSEWIDKYPEDAAAHAKSYNVPAYTASIDAAMTLVPEGCGWFAGWGQTRADEPMGGARITRNARFIGHSANYDTVAEAEGATPALALCAAALKAREATPSIKGDAS